MYENFPFHCLRATLPYFSLFLYICGFGCGGVLAAVCCCNCSVAAAVMSAIHPVAAGSAYACEFRSNLRTLLIVYKGSWILQTRAIPYYSENFYRFYPLFFQ